METKSLNLFLQPVDETSVIAVENKSIINFTKDELSEIASQIVEGVDDGTADPLDTLIIAKKLLYVAESVVEMMRGKAIIPAEKDYTKHNVKIREQMTGTRYFYDGCNDPYWNNINSQMTGLKEEIKTRETWLKSLSKPVTEKLDEETGETESFDYPVYPAAKVGSLSLVLTLK